MISFLKGGTSGKYDIDAISKKKKKGGGEGGGTRILKIQLDQHHPKRDEMKETI